MLALGEKEDPELVCGLEARRYVLLDSGSEVHTCASGFAPQTPLDTSTAGSRCLLDVQSNPIAHYGFKEVKMRLGDAEDGGDEVIAKAKFEVSGVSREVFSLGKLVNDGAVGYFEKGNCWLTKQGKSVKICERKNTFFMPVEVLDHPVKSVWKVCAAEDAYQ